MRCFITLDLPANFVEEAVNVQNTLVKANLFKGKITEKENIHLTLKFLGEVDNIDEIISRLDQISLNSFDIKLGKVGVFSKEFVRIIWIALLGANELQSKIDEVLSDMFKKEERFMGHITIARPKIIIDKDALFDTISKIKIESGKMNAPSFSLMKSTLTPKGPVYEVIKKYPLNLYNTQI